MKVRRVGQDGEVWLFAAGGFDKLVEFALDAGNVADDFDQADDVELGGVDGGADTFFAETVAGAAEEIDLAEAGAEGPDEGGGVEVAGGFAGGDQDFHG